MNKIIEQNETILWNYVTINKEVIKMNEEKSFQKNQINWVMEE